MTCLSAELLFGENVFLFVWFENFLMKTNLNTNELEEESFLSPFGFT